MTKLVISLSAAAAFGAAVLGVAAPAAAQNFINYPGYDYNAAADAVRARSASNVDQGYLSYAPQAPTKIRRQPLQTIPHLRNSQAVTGRSDSNR
jgi:hypothetical protein